MNRILRRPMFRIGGYAGTGITSGLDQPQKIASAGMDMKIKKLTEAFMLYKQQGGTLSFEEFSELYAKENFNSGGRVGYKTGTMPTFQATGLPGFLTSFGLNMLATPPRGNIFQTAATAARDPFAQLQADQIAARRLQGEKEFLRSERLEGQEFEEGQLEKRLKSAEDIAAMKSDQSLSVNQLASTYLDDYDGDLNKATNKAKFFLEIRPILANEATGVGETQIGGIIEADLSNPKQAKTFARANRNKIGKVFFDINTGTLKKLVKDPETKKLGFVPFSLTGSTQTGADDPNAFLPTKEGKDEVVPQKDIFEEITTPGLTSTDQAILDQVAENKKKIQEGYKNIGQSDFSDLYR